MIRLTDKQCFDKLTKAKCYVDTVNDADKKKVAKARAGTNPTTPSSLIAQVAAELGLRAHAQEAPAPPPPPPPPPPAPWDSGYAPQAYNQGSRGQNAIFNVRINCTLRADGRYVDKNGIVYSDSGLCEGGRSEQNIPTLKPADMKDQHEPWDAYEWMGNIIGPNKENYPEASYFV